MTARPMLGITALVLVLGCPSERREPTKAMEAPAESAAAPAAGPEAQSAEAAAPVPEGTPCETNAECQRGEVCIGPPGCDAAWSCKPRIEQGCERELASYCGCDGKTFRAMTNCPGRKYASLDRCPADDDEN